MSQTNDRVEAWMTRAVVTLDVSASVKDAARLIAGQMVSCVVVLEDDRPVGMLTERDITACAAVRGSGAIDAIPVGDVMGTPLVGLRPEDPISRAVERLESLFFRHAPVLDAKDRLVGILTQTDLLRACAQLAGLTPASGPPADTEPSSG